MEQDDRESEQKALSVRRDLQVDTSVSMDVYLRT